MIVITILYPRPAAGEIRFDFNYYENSHMAAVRGRFANAGLVRAVALRGFPDADGNPPGFVAMALLEFESMAAVQASMGGAAGGDLRNDLRNFTNLTPIMQVNEIVQP